MSYPRRYPLLRILVALIVLVPLVGAGLLFVVNLDGLKPAIARAVLRATGRELVVQGHLRILPTLPLTIEARRVGLANGPGGARSQMVTFGRVRARLSLLPLLTGRVELARVDLGQPEILLETDKEGHPNWHFMPPAPAAPNRDAAPSVPAAEPTALAVRELRVENGRLTWHDARSGRSVSVRVPRLDARAAGADSPVVLTASLLVDGRPVTVSGRTGPIARLLAASATAPWPVQITLETHDARLTASGSLGQPLSGRGYAFQVTGAVADLSAFSDVAGIGLPPLHDVEATVSLADGGGAWPALSRLLLRVGASDLQSLVPGLALSQAEVSAAGADEPVHVDLQGSLRDTKLHLTGQLGTPATLLPTAGKTGVFPIDLGAGAAGASVTLKGGIAAPLILSGIDLAISAHIPALAALSPLAGRKLPALSDIAFDGRVTDSAGGYAEAVALHGFTLQLPQGDLGGDLDLALGGRPTIRGTLTASRIDLDALRVALAVAEAPSASPPEAPATAPPAAVPAPAPSRLIPDTRLKLDGLTRANVDLGFTIGELRAGGAVHGDVAGRLHVQDGRLALDPFTGRMQGGGFDMKLGLDAEGAAPPASLTLRAPALALQPLVAALNLPGEATGTVEVDAALSGVGASPHALAAGLDGHLVLVMTDGELDNQLLAAVLGGVLRAARLPQELGAGRTKLRCLAVRLDAAHGVASLSTLFVDTGRLQLQGGGTLNLGEESLALRLRPLLHVGPGVVLPVRVDGSFQRPKVTSDAAATVAGLAGKDGAPAQAPGTAASDNESCAAATAAARGLRPVPAAAGAPAPAPAPPPGKPPRPVDVLRRSLR
jgi:AsmA protein